MIRPLRKRHRVMVTALAVVVPVLFGAALLLRQPPAVMDPLPDALHPPAPAYPALLSEAPDRWGDLDIVTRLRADGTPPARLAVELQPTTPLRAPDVLVYWHAGTASAQDALPDGAYLLGALAGTQARRFALPDSALHADGQLILYSLAHQATLATASLSTRQP